MKIFIGWDSREEIAYEVCRASLLKHTSIPLDIRPIKQYELREKSLYWRERDPLSSTEFSFTRFLTPHLANHEGWAVFMAWRHRRVDRLHGRCEGGVRGQAQLQPAREEQDGRGRADTVPAQELVKSDADELQSSVSEETHGRGCEPLFWIVFT